MSEKVEARNLEKEKMEEALVERSEEETIHTKAKQWEEKMKKRLVAKG